MADEKPCPLCQDDARITSEFIHSVYKRMMRSKVYALETRSKRVRQIRMAVYDALHDVYLEAIMARNGVKEKQ